VAKRKQRNNRGKPMRCDEKWFAELVLRGRKFTFSQQKPRARTQVQAMRALIRTKIWCMQVQKISIFRFLQAKQK
jgi:hypothetical protein